MKKVLFFLGLICIATYSIAQNNLFQYNNNVGIGVTNPWAKLDVRTAGTNGGDQSALNLNNPSNDSYATVSLIMGLSDVTSSMISVQRNNSTKGSSLFFHTSDANGVNHPRMWISDFGNVGIGNLNPQTKLHVTGDIAAVPDDGIKGFVQLWHDNAIIWQKQTPNACMRFGAASDLSAANWTEMMRITDNGNVGIGTYNPQSKLTVAGDISSRKVKVTIDAGADFVFDQGYDLLQIDSLTKFLKVHKHLPGMASAKDMEKNGIELSDMNIKLLQKIEELTLYTIDQQKQIDQKNKQVENMNDRLSKLEELIKKMETQLMRSNN